MKAEEEPATSAPAGVVEAVSDMQPALMALLVGALMITPPGLR